MELNENNPLRLSSVLPATDSSATIWSYIAEILAESDTTDTSLIHGIAMDVPDMLNKASLAALQRIALKYLEEWMGPRRSGSPLRGNGGTGVDRTVEDNLLHLLEKAVTADALQKESQLLIGALRQFALKKKATLPKCYFHQLMDKHDGHFGQPASSNDNRGSGDAKVTEFSGFRNHCHQNSDNQNAENHNKDNDGRRESLSTGSKLQRLKKTAQSSIAGTTVLQGHPSGHQKPPQQNGADSQLQRGKSTVSSTDRSRSMQENPGCLKQPAEEIHQHKAKKLKRSRHITFSDKILPEAPLEPEGSCGLGEKSTVSSTGRNRSMQENPGCRKQPAEEIHQHKAKKLKRSRHITCNDKILPEAPLEPEGSRGLGEKSPLHKAQHTTRECPQSNKILPSDNNRHILPEEASGSRQNTRIANSEPLTCTNTRKKQDSRGGTKIIQPPISRIGGSNDELRIPGVAGEVDVCHAHQNKVVNERNQQSRASVFQDASKSNMTANGSCFKCDKGGQLLNCSGSGCSVSVHASCVGQLIKFDRNGCFICPLCYQRKAAFSYTRAKKRFHQSQEELNIFLDKDPH